MLRTMMILVVIVLEDQWAHWGWLGSVMLVRVTLLDMKKVVMKSMMMASPSFVLLSEVFVVEVMAGRSCYA